jgi:hypothetical protein
MELDDIIVSGTRPTTLRFLLGLMEDADNSLETYKWATPALLHAIHTQDPQLSEYVEEVFKRKGLNPYQCYKNDKPEELSLEKAIGQKIMNEQVMRSKAKMALEELMTKKDAKGEPLFCQKNHWWAVFRLFVDLQVCNIRENRYKEFIELIESLGMVGMNAPLDMATLSNITQDIYRFPFTRWELKVPKDASSRWMSSYTRMYQIAEELKTILIKKGF